MESQALTVRLPGDLYERLRQKAFSDRVSQNSILTEALELALSEEAVTLITRNANQAERLRRLIREHHALGIPFPNNSTDWPQFRGVSASECPPSVGVTLAGEKNGNQ